MSQKRASHQNPINSFDACSIDSLAATLTFLALGREKRKPSLAFAFHEPNPSTAGKGKLLLIRKQVPHFCFLCRHIVRPARVWFGDDRNLLNNFKVDARVNKRLSLLGIVRQ